MTLGQILAAKGNEVYTITPDATLRQLAKRLVQCRVGALPVFPAGHQGRAEQMLGIVSERDLLRICADDDSSLDQVLVAEVMSTPVITAKPDDSVEGVMGLMTRERKRHLPVFAEGRLIGIVSIGDIVKSQHDRLAIENRFMKDYIGG